MENVRVYEIPACKMVSSPCAMFGEGKLEAFADWFDQFERSAFPKDYLFFDAAQGGFTWYYIHDAGMSVPEAFDIVEFPGGLYAVATDVDGQSDEPARSAIRAFLERNPCFEPDPNREPLGNIITPPSASRAMGYNQMDYYTPIRVASRRPNGGQR